MLDRFDTRPRVKKKLNVLPENPEVSEPEAAVGLGRFPSWLHRKLPKGSGLPTTGYVLSQKRLHTVCEEAKCPNLLECWSKKTATFLVMGKQCTRNCGFCDIQFNKNPAALEADEPQRIVESVLELGLKHVVITMVARDDLPDGGAEHLARIITEVRRQIPSTTIEVLTSDFYGVEEALDTVVNARPDVFNHNLETVRELTPRVRHKATYERTLNVLNYVSKRKNLLVKSGLMLGLGEDASQVHESLRDLRDAGVSIVTLGQYLQPNRNKLLVKQFITPQQFEEYAEYGRSLGIKHMFAGPFVRSSYNADILFNETKSEM